MTLNSPLSRRRLIQRACLTTAAFGLGAPAIAQAPRGQASARSLTIAQLYDVSLAEQDVAKDFLIGSRAAWQDINARGGLRGRTVQHVALEVDGSDQSLRETVAQLRDNASCVAVSGTVSDALARKLMALLRQENLGLAHVAPWLQSFTVEPDDRTFPIFATRHEQITHALRSLAGMGSQEVGAVFASQHQLDLHGADLQRLAKNLKLKLSAFYPQAASDLQQLGRRMGPQTPAVLLFLGGTPELMQFTRGMDRQSRQRYVVALADVNLNTLSQMGAAKATPIIATQAVPVVTAALPAVRQYRDVMDRLFDETPEALGLAGFLAARYTYQVLADIDGPVTRAAALAAFQRRADVDLGGVRISFDGRRPRTPYVTQSMLTPDGRVIG